MFYQLKVIRKKSKPPIWRRIVVPSNITFAQLAVILERILEVPFTGDFEFEFYNRKTRFVEWNSKNQKVSDFYYSYWSAADTFINPWMEEKAFTFRIVDSVSMPEYRLEIEKCHESVSVEEDGSFRVIHYPMILKQVSSGSDEYWSDPEVINKEMEERYFLGKICEGYPSTSEVIAKMNKGEGISFSEKMVDRTDRNKESAQELIKKLADTIDKRIALEKRLKEYKANEKKAESTAYKTIPDASSARRECKLQDYLKSYDKEDLLSLADELGIVAPKRKDKLTYEIARSLLTASTMKARLLKLEEEELDAFEDVIERGRHVPTDKEWELLDPIYDLDYISTYGDDSVQVPDEVIFLYQSIVRNGYRDYHRSASWLLKCIKAASFLYMSFPLEILFQLYLKNKAVKSDYKEFCNYLKSISERVSGCILKDNRLVFKEIYDTGAYLSLEKRRRGDFYIPNRKEIETLIKDGYPSYEHAYQRMLKFLCQTLGHQEEFATYLCQIMYQTFAAGGMISDFMKIVNGMQMEFHSEENAKIFVDLLMTVYNETRMIELKGHKPNEMSKISYAPQKTEKKTSGQKQQEKKIYPNDPCPCRSGKKYKKCCGKVPGGRGRWTVSE